MPLQGHPVELDGNQIRLFGCKKAFWNLKIIPFSAYKTYQGEINFLGQK